MIALPPTGQMMIIVSGWVEFGRRNDINDPVIATLICSALPGTMVGWVRKVLI
jgi:hypothetical protein